MARRNSGSNGWKGYSNYTLISKDKATIKKLISSDRTVEDCLNELIEDGLNVSIKPKEQGGVNSVMVTVMRSDNKADDAGIALVQSSKELTRAVFASWFVYFTVFEGELKLSVADDW